MGSDDRKEAIDAWNRRTGEDRVTNLEYIRTCTKEELAVLLCEMHTYCTSCVANRYCGNRHIGFIDWLDEEREGEDE